MDKALAASDTAAGAKPAVPTLHHLHACRAPAEVGVGQGLRASPLGFDVVCRRETGQGSSQSPDAIAPYCCPAELQLTDASHLSSPVRQVGTVDSDIQTKLNEAQKI